MPRRQLGDQLVVLDDKHPAVRVPCSRLATAAARRGLAGR